MAASPRAAHEQPTICAGLQPFIVTLIAWRLLGESPSVSRVVGLTIVAMGVICLVIDAFQGNGAVLYGDVLMIGASACWAAYSVLLRRWSISPWDATIGVTLITALLYLPVYVLMLPKQMAHASWSDIATQAVYQGVMATIIQMVLYVRTVALIGPTRLGMLMALIPGIAGIAAIPLLGESMSFWVFTGLVLVSLGVWLGNRNDFFIRRRM